MVEAICKAVPVLTRHPPEDVDRLIPSDEQSKKKQVLKDRKKVRISAVVFDHYNILLPPNVVCRYSL